VAAMGSQAPLDEAPLDELHLGSVAARGSLSVDGVLQLWAKIALLKQIKQMRESLLFRAAMSRPCADKFAVNNRMSILSGIPSGNS
jgi:hypothetical protein